MIGTQKQSDKTNSAIQQPVSQKNLFEVWKVLNDNSLKMIALLNTPYTSQAKTSIFVQGVVSKADLLNYFVNNYDGDIEPFEIPFKETEFSQMHIEFNFTFQETGHHTNLRNACYKDTLYTVLKKMVDYKISIIPITETSDPASKLVGFYYLNDVYYLLRTGHFYMLDRQVLDMLKVLYKGESFTRVVNSSGDTGEFDLSQPTDQGVMSNDEETLNISDQEMEQCQSQQDQSECSGRSNSIDQVNFQPITTETLTKRASLTLPDREDLIYQAVYGIERVMIFDESDTIRNVMEKIAVAPERKVIAINLEE